MWRLKFTTSLESNNLLDQVLFQNERLIKGIFTFRYIKLFLNMHLKVSFQVTLAKNSPCHNPIFSFVKKDYK